MLIAVAFLDIPVSDRYMAATQMEGKVNPYARRVFPCFDSPQYKATFNITVLRKRPHISLSNMNLLRTEKRYAAKYEVHPFVS